MRAARVEARTLETSTQREPNDNRNVSAEWVKRPFVPEDENGLIYLWEKSYAHSSYGKARGAHRDGTADERAYWNDQAPTVEWLLANADVTVICDPERAQYEPGLPAIIWAFACTSGDTVHYVCVKRAAARAGLGADIVRDMLGGRLDKPCGYTHELVEMRSAACGVRLPRDWYVDSTWFGRRLLGTRRAA